MAQISDFDAASGWTTRWATAISGFGPGQELAVASEGPVQHQHRTLRAALCRTARLSCGAMQTDPGSRRLHRL